MLAPQVTALVDSYVAAYDSKHPLVFKEREARQHIRHGQRIGGDVRWDGALDQGDFVQMGKFLEGFLRERTAHVWEKVQEAIKSCEVRPYPGLAADIREYLKTKYDPHLNKITQILNESAKQFNIGTGYASELVRHCNIVFADLHADVAMFCAKYESDHNKRTMGTVTYNFGNVSGANARVVINSNDYSINISNADQVFNQIFKTINEAVPDGSKRAELIARTADMQANIGKPSFKDAYYKWVSVAADHAQLITFAPFMAELLRQLSL